jgi:hypothetical protein
VPAPEPGAGSRKPKPPPARKPGTCCSVSRRVVLCCNPSFGVATRRDGSQLVVLRCTTSEHVLMRRTTSQAVARRCNPSHCVATRLSAPATRLMLMPAENRRLRSVKKSRHKNTYQHRERANCLLRARVLTAGSCPYPSAVRSSRRTIDATIPFQRSITHSCDTVLRGCSGDESRSSPGTSRPGSQGRADAAEAATKATAGCLADSSNSACAASGILALTDEVAPGSLDAQAQSGSHRPPMHSSHGKPVSAYFAQAKPAPAPWHPTAHGPPKTKGPQVSWPFFEPRSFPQAVSNNHLF